MRAALFSPIKEGDEAIGPLVETAIFSQWFHDQQAERLSYARWKDGEVDLVYLDQRRKPSWLVEVKWSDRAAKNRDEISGLLEFCRANRLKDAVVTTLTVSEVRTYGEVRVEFVPTSLYCLSVGHNLIRHRRAWSSSPLLDRGPKMMVGPET